MKDIYTHILEHDYLDKPLEEYDSTEIEQEERVFTDLCQEVYLDLLEIYGEDGAKELY